ncbi:ABC transporter substrate-binding protein [Streptomyces sp. NPDC005529]|uniref:ABC transporter substrate-binding protein n=1 Tax=unclassified Streptomyces TaxID=2593676 RepID=UPI0033B87959
MNRKLRGLAALTTLILAAAGCSASGGGSSSTPGVTDTTITIGSHQPLTGPASAGWKERAAASKAYFDFVNARGGIHGRKIIYIYKDDAYKAENTVRVVHRLVERDKVFAIFTGFGTATHQAVVKYLNDRKIPDLFPVSGCVCWDDPHKLPYTFAWRTDFTREGKILGHYVMDKYPGKKIAYFYQDDGYGRGVVDGLDKVVPRSLVVAREALPSVAENVTRQMRAIDRSKADVIITGVAAPDAALLRLAQQKIGNTAPLVVTAGQGDPGTLDALLPSGHRTHSKLGNKLTQGIITSTYLTPMDAQNSWNTLLRKIHDEDLPNAPYDLHFQLGVAMAYTFVQALQHTGRDLTRQSLVATMENDGSKFSPGFGIVPFGYSHSSHAGYIGAQISVIQGNSSVLQGKPLTTDEGNGPVTQSTTEVPPAPANGIPDQ